MKEPDHLHDLLRKHLQGESLDAIEKEIFQSWRNDHEEAYQQYKKIWSQSAGLKLHQDVDVSEQWENWKHQQNRPVKPAWYAVAAVISILILATIALFQINKPTIYTVAPGEQMQVLVLSDSSYVWLNSNSRLIVENDFNEIMREVRLEGEGYFEVRSNREKPFIVRNDFSSIEVLGTKFNAISHDSINEVQLLEGKVAFSDLLDKSITLNPGEEATISRGSEIVHSTFSNQNFLSWKTGILQFDNQPMSSLIAALEKHYDVDISLYDDRMGTCRVTITFDNVSLEEALSELSFLLDLEYSIQGKNVNIKGKGCDE